MATPPRWSLPGTYLVTRCTLLRMLLLKPDPVINALILFVLGLAATRYGIQLHVFTFLSTHGHLLVTDPDGKRLARFNQLFFSLTARAINCYRGRQESLWSSGKPSCVYIPPLARDIAEKIAYVLCNAVLSELVDRVSKWPGVQVAVDDVGRVSITAHRPKFFFRPKGKVPEVITFTLGLPKCIDATEEELAALIRRRCDEIEREKRGQMVDSGRPFLGVAKILAADPDDTPRIPRPLFGLEPHVACKDTSLRVSLLGRLKQFRAQYRVALAQYRAGIRDTVFPWGTLKMVLQFGCRCRGPDPEPAFGGLAL